MRYIVTLILATLSLYSLDITSQYEFQLMKEDDPNYGKQRRIWMEEMHRTAPDFNWKLNNMQIREYKLEKRNKRIAEYLLQKKELPQADTVANGKIIGEWIERGSNNLSGRMLTCDIDWNDTLLYMASSGGNIWRGTLQGENWTCLNNTFQMTGIVLLKVFYINDVRRIFVVSGTRAFYTDDDGLTWIKATGLDKPQSWGGVKRAVRTIDGIIYFLGNEWDSETSKSKTVLYKSTDNGESFEPIYVLAKDKKYCDLWTSRYDDSKVFFSHYDTLSLVNVDNSIHNLAEIPYDYSDYKQSRLSGNFSNEKTTIVLYLQDKSNNGNFFSTDDDGETWNEHGVVNYGPFSSNSFEVSAVYPEAMYYGGVECSRSHDNGDSWEIVNKWGAYYGDMENKLHADLPAITSFRDPEGEEVLIISTDGGAYISYDNLLTVNNISLHNLNVSQYYGSYSYQEDPDIIFVGAQDQGFQRTVAIAEDGTHSFEQTISGDYGHLTSSDGGVTLWTVYPGFSMAYKNLAVPSATTRTSLDFDATGTGGLWMRPILADPSDPNIAYLAGGGTDGFHHIWKLNYSGGRIHASEMPFQFSEKHAVSALAISNINKELFYAMTKNGDFFYSTDKGTNWTKSDAFDGLGGHYFYGASVMPSNVDANTVYIAGSGYSNPGAYKSTDNGVSFTPIDSGLPNTLVYRIAISEDDEYIFAATAVGPYVYIAEEEMWFELSDMNAPDQTYWSVEYLPQISTARFVTYGRGIWDFVLEGRNRIQAASLTEPENNSTDITLDTILKWSFPENAEYFQIQIAKNNSFTEIVYEQDSLFTNELSSDFLIPNTTYYWRVKSKNGENFSTWSTVFSFSTVRMVPEKVTILYPSNNAVQIPLMPTFEWNEIEYATKYHFILSSDEELKDILYEDPYLKLNAIEIDSYLEQNTDYYWTVNAYIGNEESGFLETKTFKTVMPRPDVPILLSPENGEQGVPLNIKLDWSEVTDADYYHLNLAADNQFNNILFDKDTIGWYTYKFTDELESYKMYMWRVRAHNLSGYGEWSETGMFVTGNEINVLESLSENDIMLSPNPVQDIVNVMIKSDNNSDINIKVLDLLGNELLELSKSISSNTVFPIDLSSLDISKQQVLFFHIRLNNQLVVKKIVYNP